MKSALIQNFALLAFFCVQAFLITRIFLWSRLYQLVIFQASETFGNVLQVIEDIRTKVCTCFWYFYCKETLNMHSLIIHLIIKHFVLHRSREMLPCPRIEHLSCCFFTRVSRCLIRQRKLLKWPRSVFTHCSMQRCNFVASSQTSQTYFYTGFQGIKASCMPERKCEVIVPHE